MRTLIAVYLLSLTSLSFSADFSGTYQCKISDHSDGDFKATLMLDKDITASFSDSGYTSYTLKLNVVGMPYYYTGIATARGNDLAIYFESTGEKKNPNDRGVGIATVIAERNKKDKEIITLHKFYYEKFYKGKSNYGFEKCFKTE